MMSNYLSTVTIEDCVGPEFAACLDAIEADSRYLSEFLTDEQAEHTMCANMAQTKVWDRLWRFGIITDEDMAWYMPSDYDTELDIIQLEERDDRDICPALA